MKNKKLKLSVLWALICVLLFAGALVSCGRHAGGAIEDEPVAEGPAYDSRKAYPITVEAKKAVFVEEGTTKVLRVTDFEDPDTAPKPTASVSSAKKGADIEITVPTITGYIVSGGLSHIVAPSKEKASLNKYNTFKMPLGPATVTIVYVNNDEILMLPTYYSNALYTLDMPRGSVDSSVPDLITTPFPNNNAASYYGASIAYSASPGMIGPANEEITPIPENFLADAEWSFANSAWEDTTNKSLSTESDINYFRINVKVKPQVLYDYPSGLGAVSDETKSSEVAGTGKTVAEMYAEAVEGVYHFRVIRNDPNTDARLYSINISGISAFYIEGIGTQPTAPYGTSVNDYAPVTYTATTPFGTSEVDVVAETNDPNSKVRIDDISSDFESGNINETVEIGDTLQKTFIIRVKAEDVNQVKLYTIKLTNAASAIYTPQASGGNYYFEEKEVAGGRKEVYEIHSFYLVKTTTVPPGGQKSLVDGTETPLTLDFVEDSRPATVDILLVGGGGAGGNYTSGLADSKTGSGGAGGVIYIKGYALGTSNTYMVKVGNGGGSGQASVIETFTADGSVRNIKAGQKGGDSFFGASVNDPNRLLAPGGGGGADNNNANGKLWGGKGGSSGGSTETNARGGYWNTVSTPLLDFYYDGSSKQPNGTVKNDFTPDTGMAWGHMGVVRRDGDDRRNNSWAGGGAGSEPTAMVRTGFNQAGIDYGRGIKIDITGTEREYARSFLSGQGNPTAGSSQTGNGGAGGAGKHGAAGGSGIVIVKWLHSEVEPTPEP